MKAIKDLLFSFLFYIWFNHPSDTTLPLASVLFPPHSTFSEWVFHYTLPFRRIKILVRVCLRTYDSKSSQGLSSFLLHSFSDKSNEGGVGESCTHSAGSVTRGPSSSCHSCSTPTCRHTARNTKYARGAGSNSKTLPKLFSHVLLHLHLGATQKFWPLWRMMKMHHAQPIIANCKSNNNDDNDDDNNNNNNSSDNISTFQNKVQNKWIMKKWFKKSIK